MPLELLHPRYWLTWLGMLLLRLSVFLPWQAQMALGGGLGSVLYRLLPSRRKISCINLEIAFPELSPEERESINHQHFVSLGQGLFEAALGWWGSVEKIRKLTHTEGMDYLEKALKEGPVILLGAHFVSIEMGGRMVAQHMPIHGVYRPHQNKLIDYLVDLQRNKQYGKVIPKNNIRDMIKSLKSGFPVWYATDQNYRKKGSLLVPFFNIDAPTNPGTSRLAKMTKAKILPCMSVRLNSASDQRKGYLFRVSPPLDNFPTDDVYADTKRLNEIIEEQIQDFPSQYLWTHKRYKYYATEKKDFYKEYMTNTSSHCK